MVFIEMLIKRDVNPTGLAPRLMPRKDSYVWLIGADWPVSVDEDVYVGRIEAFGPELDSMLADMGIPEGRRVGPTVDWRFPQAGYISELMRIHAAKKRRTG